MDSTAVMTSGGRNVGGLEFIASLVGSLAWPVLIGVVVLLLRAPISKALTSGPMKRLKAGPAGVEVEWTERLEEVESEAEKSALPELPSAEPAVVEAGTIDAVEVGRELQAVVELSPRAAVLESFSRLEATLREAVPTQDRRPASIRRLGSLAVEARILTEQEAGILNDLTTLRNVAAHESLDMDADQARVFVDLAARLVRSIEATPPSWPQ